MIQVRDTKLVLIWLTLAGSLVVSLYLIQAGLVSAIEPIVVFLSGMVAFFVLWVTSLTVSALARELDSRTVKPEIAFDEVTVRQSLREGRESLPVGADDSTNIVEADFRELASPGSLGAQELLELDKALALAKVRMDLEAELRQIARSHDVVSRARSAGALANELGQKGILPRPLVSALLDVVSVANRAVHGANVSDETAASVVRAASELLFSLRLASVGSEPMRSFATLDEFKNWLASGAASRYFPDSDLAVLHGLVDGVLNRRSPLTSIRNIRVLATPDGHLRFITFDES